MSQAKISIRGLDAYYGEFQALAGVDLDIPANSLFTVMGPTGSGKTTLMRTINRLNDIVKGFRATGQVTVDGQDVYEPTVDVPSLRRKVGMVFAVTTPLPLTTFDNVAYGPRVRGTRSETQIAEIVERCLRDALLWDEVGSRLHDPASKLSGGQQQRLSLARVLALEPEIILLDEPASGLDPVSTARLEDLMRRLSKSYTVVLVTHNPLQAARVGEMTAFLYMGRLVEVGPTSQLFTSPKDKRTEDYVLGRFG
jgi:phosphate transport system ATP-binding protein